MTDFEALDKKLALAERKSVYNKTHYWKIRLATINYLGGKCSCCNESGVTKLEIHHVHPTQNGGYKGVPGAIKLQEWKRIVSGDVKAILYCKECHLKYGHNGSTYDLRKR